MYSIQEDIKTIINTCSNEGEVFENKTILVTGGAGFLGSWICDVLIGLGGRVLCLDNFSSGRNANIEHLLKLDKFIFKEGDISEPFSFDEDIDFVLHFASRASPLEFAKFPIEILKANTFGTYNALTISNKNDATFVYASTSEVYGNPDPQYIPTSESYNGNVNPVGVRSCYDESKRVGESFVMAFHSKYSVDSRILRIHNTYGPRMRAGDVYGRVVTRFIDQALNGNHLSLFGDGSQTRSFTYITDLIRGIITAAYKKNISGTILNLGSPWEMTISELAKIIIQITGSKSIIEHFPLPPDDPLRRCPNISRAKKTLNWEPKVQLADGLRNTIDWNRQNK